MNGRGRKAWVGAVGLVWMTASVASERPTEPATVKHVAQEIGFTPEHIRQAIAGDIVFTGTRETSERELAVAIAMLTPQSVAELARDLHNNVLLESDDTVLWFSQIKSDLDLGVEEVVASFSDARFTSDESAEARRLMDRHTRPTFNLSSAELSRFQVLPSTWSDPGAAYDVRMCESVARCYQRVLAERFRAYCELGLSGVRSYRRGHSGRYHPGQDLIRATQAETHLQKFAPGFYEALLHYPEKQSKAVEHQFLCIKQKVEQRPCFILMHRMLRRDDTGMIAAERQFYVGRSYNALQITYAALPTPAGSMLFYTNRTSTDQVAGFGRRLRHAIGRSMIEKDVISFFSKLRSQAQKGQQLANDNSVPSL